MAELSFLQTQRASLAQRQVMSQKQILALKLIAMQNGDLRNEIYKQAEENPAIEIVRDTMQESPAFRKSSSHIGLASASGASESDTFQKMLESTVDKRETLQQHLLHQLNMIKTTDEEFELCKRIIQNLDSQGYYILAPHSLVGKTESEQRNLEKCISIVRQFDPQGICCVDFAESLKIQAELKKDASPIAKFILDGHLEFISPPDAEKSLKKITAYLHDQKKLVFQNETVSIDESDLMLQNVENAIKYIQSLNPFPARDFGVDTEAHFITPDVVVTIEEGALERESVDDGLIFNTDKTFFRIKNDDSSIPKVTVNDEFKKFTERKQMTDDFARQENRALVLEQLRNARNFIDSLDFRRQVILRTASELVKLQKEFFRSGQGNLNPLTQRQFAEIISVHESTVSRMADSKFIRCKWGTFPMKYFFSGAVKAEDASASTDKVKAEIASILKAQKPGEKRLSDQKIADILKQKGYSLARRTVAKYRAQMNIESSYGR
ncbi:MAG: hypothetical protein HDR34_03160 [Treponema sp.]|nr:hypothetical protein [Treponema sp.]